MDEKQDFATSLGEAERGFPECLFSRDGEGGVKRPLEHEIHICFTTQGFAQVLEKNYLNFVPTKTMAHQYILCDLHVMKT